MAFDEMMLLQLGLIQRKREVAAVIGTISQRAETRSRRLSNDSHIN